MQIIVHSKGVQCPVCNVGEMEPEDNRTDIQWFEKFVAIRGFKLQIDPVDGWWSECLHCKEIFGNGWFSQHNRKLEGNGGFPGAETIEGRRELLREWELGEGPFTAQQRKAWVDFLATEAEQGG